MQLAFTFRPPPPVSAGALAHEARLCEAVRAHVEAARRDPALLQRPVRVLVPSRSLRLHVAAVLAERLGPHVLGVSVQTLHGLAEELAGTDDEAAEARSLLGRVLALRHGRAEPALASLLHDFDDAEEAVLRAVSELADAGMHAAHAEAAVDALDEAEALSPGERARAAAVVRAAAATEADGDALGFVTPARVLRAAAERLGAPGHPGLRARALLLYGFADATGVAADLLEALAALPGAVFFTDLPADPAEPGVVDVSARFGARLRERLRIPGTPQLWGQPGALDVFSAEGDDGECLEVARRVAELLEQGERPEGVGIVARDFTAKAPALRRHLDRLGVPYSGVGLAGPDTPLARWRGLVALLGEGERLPVDTWLALVGSVEAPPPGGQSPPPLSPALRAASRLGLRASGVARLGQAARLDADRLLKKSDHLALPGGGTFDGPRTAHRRLPAAVLRGLLRAAKGTVAWGAALPETEKPAVWLDQLRRLVVEHLGQPADHPVLAALAPLGELPALRLDRVELRLLVRALLADFGRGTFGGRGGGVQVLEVREARGRTFQHLFLLGNNRRNVSPRDAVLSDPVRSALRAVLPDLPLRRDRFDEDRHHFSWLCSSAPRLTLSFQALSSTGKTESVSPLLERLRWSGRWTHAATARASYPRVLPPTFTASERATLVSLRGGVEGGAPHFEAAIAASRRGLGVNLAAAAVVAEARRAVLAEKDGSSGPGPYFGFLGRVTDPEDPRTRRMFVSARRSPSPTRSRRCRKRATGWWASSYTGSWKPWFVAAFVSPVAAWRGCASASRWRCPGPARRSTGSPGPPPPGFWRKRACECRASRSCSRSVPDRSWRRRGARIGRRRGPWSWGPK